MFQICKKPRSFEFRHRLETKKYVFFEKNPKIAIFGYFLYEKWLFLDFSQKIRIFECSNEAKTRKNGFFYIFGASFFCFFKIPIGRNHIKFNK